MRHESSSIKSRCCKVWRRSWTGAFLFYWVLFRVGGARRLLFWAVVHRRGLQVSGKLAHMPSDKQEAPSGLLRIRPVVWMRDRFVAGRGLMQMRCMRFDAFTARCSWKSRQCHRSWQCLLSGRRTSGADRPSLRKFRQVPSCARSLLCEPHRLRCRSNRLRP